MRSFNNHYVYKKILPIVIMIFFVLAGIIKIDIVNTKALSPLGNTNENYELVSEKFGEDFSNFIKDNSYLKIYRQEKNILVRLGNQDFKVNDQSIFAKEIKGIFEKVATGVNGAKETIEKLL